MYVARDKNRMLYVFEEKPIKNKNFENWTPLSADENFMEIEEDGIYEMYYDYQERVKYIASHRVLAINRAEKEKVLR